MTRLLRINSSSRVEGSHSAAIADVFEAEYRRKHQGCDVITRNVADGSIPFIAQKTIEGFYAPQEALTADLKSATALSDELIAELQSADTVLLAVPIYNFTIPAALKAWIDQIMRIGHTFTMDETGFKGLVCAQRVVIVCAYGSEGYLAEEPFAAANFLEPYLKFLFAFLGVEKIDFVHVQGTATAGQEDFTGRLDTAKAEAKRAA